MIKMLAACTSELDFPDEALDEILAQLDIGNTLLKNAAGIVHCGHAFIESGFIHLLSEKLPFALVGSTTLACATGASCGPDVFSISVLTSDEVAFSVARTGPLTPQDVGDAIGAAYRRAAGAFPVKPALVLAQLPLNLSLSLGISRILGAISSAGDGVPVFGGLPCDATADYRESFVICNGDALSDEAALLLLCGDVRPRFFVENVSCPEDLQEQLGIITESDGCLLKRVNDMPFLEYVEDVGISSEIMRSVKVFPVPFKVNYNEGTKSLIRVLYSVTPEGYAVFASDMPMGASFSMQRFSYDSVMETVENMAEALAALPDVSGVLMYSCVGRNFRLGRRANDEMRALAARLGGTTYHLSYANGEICPLEDETGALVNHSHNYSLVACVF
jgi:hypothetical protein